MNLKQQIESSININQLINIVDEKAVNRYTNWLDKMNNANEDTCCIKYYGNYENDRIMYNLDNLLKNLNSLVNDLEE